MANNQAIQDLGKKLQFEAKFRGQVRRGFFKERAIFRNEVVPEGRIMNPNGISKIWNQILGLHYGRVAFSFAVLDEESPLAQDIVTGKVRTFVKNKVIQSTRFISNTSKSHMLMARAEAHRLLRESGTAITDRSLSRVGGQVLRRLQSPRSENIVVTETQSAAEGAKSVKSKVEEKNRKEWITVSDGKVRPAHVASHGQVRLMDNPFNVGNEKLKYPGDTSLGASVGNVAYCRCAAIYG